MFCPRDSKHCWLHIMLPCEKADGPRLRGLVGNTSSYMGNVYEYIWTFYIHHHTSTYHIEKFQENMEIISFRKQILDLNKKWNNPCFSTMLTLRSKTKNTISYSMIHLHLWVQSTGGNSPNLDVSMAFLHCLVLKVVSQGPSWLIKMFNSSTWTIWATSFCQPQEWEIPIYTSWWNMLKKRWHRHIDKRYTFLTNL